MFDPAAQAEAEDEAKAAWGVRLDHYSGQTWAGTSRLEIIGDTPTLTRFYDLVGATAHDQLDPDLPADVQPSLDHRKVAALGIIADGAGAATRTKLYLHLDCGRPARAARADGHGREARAAHPRKDPGVARDKQVHPATCPGPRRSGRRRRARPAGVDARARRSSETAPVSTPTATKTRGTATSTTSRPSWRWTTAAHRARPGPTTWRPFAGDIIGPRPTTAGPTSATGTAATPGPARTATATRLTLAESSPGTEPTTRVSVVLRPARLHSGLLPARAGCQCRAHSLAHHRLGPTRRCPRRRRRGGRGTVGAGSAGRRRVLRALRDRRAWHASTSRADRAARGRRPLSVRAQPDVRRRRLDDRRAGAAVPQRRGRASGSSCSWSPWWPSSRATRSLGSRSSSGSRTSGTAGRCRAGGHG